MSLTAPRVPRLWPGSTMVVLGSGPSLHPLDVGYVVDAARAPGPEIRVLAISDAYTLAPYADVLYAPDARWWDWHQDAVNVPAHKYSLQQTNFATVVRLAPGHRTLIETDTRFLSTGGHGGWQAINLALHLGAARIVLLGYDFQPAEDGRHHFFGEHPNQTHVRYAQWLSLYDTLIDQLRPLGISIVNASRRTAIQSIPHVSLDLALHPLGLCCDP